MIAFNLFKVAKEFGIKSEDKRLVLKELRAIMLKLHPNNTMGVFPDDKTKEDFLKIQKVLEIEEETSKELIPLSVIKDLMHYSNELSKAAKQSNIESRLKESIKDYEPEIGKRAQLPKISFTALTTIISFLWLFPSQIADHPVLSKLLSIESSAFSVIWATMLLYTILFWIMGHRNANKEKRILRRLKTDKYQTSTYNEFVCEIESKGTFIFSRSDFNHFISQRLERNASLNIFFQSDIDEEIYENLSDLIITKAEQKRLIIEIEGNGIEDKYELISNKQSKY